jgi:hypothetical protein
MHSGVGKPTAAKAVGQRMQVPVVYHQLVAEETRDVELGARVLVMGTTMMMMRMTHEGLEQPTGGQVDEKGMALIEDSVVKGARDQTGPLMPKRIETVVAEGVTVIGSHEMTRVEGLQVSPPAKEEGVGVTKRSVRGVGPQQRMQARSHRV